jgi:hypothetical protein
MTRCNKQASKDLEVLKTILVRRHSLVVLVEKRLSDDRKLAASKEEFPLLTKIQAEKIRMVGRVGALLEGAPV